MFPSSWGVNAAVHALLVVGLLAVSWWFWTPARRDDRRVIAAWVATLLVVCVAGVWFAEVTPIGAAFLLQPIRSFQFLEFLVILGVANLVVVACTRAQPVPGFFTAIVASLALVITGPGRDAAVRHVPDHAGVPGVGSLRGAAARPPRIRDCACALVALTGRMAGGGAAGRLVGVLGDERAGCELARRAELGAGAYRTFATPSSCRPGCTTSSASGVSAPCTPIGRMAG
jgi:hypothetical protein